MLEKYRGVWYNAVNGGKVMAKFTANAIKASFLKLLNEKAFNKITVKDIVEDCGINRNSFYYHFQDLPALAEETVTDEINKLIAKYPAVESLEECLAIAAEFALANRRAAYHIFNSVNRDILERYLWRICDYVVKTYMNAAFEGRRISGNDREMIINYYRCGIFGQIVGWLDSGMKEDMVLQNRRLFALRKGLLEELLNRCEEDTAS